MRWGLKQILLNCYIHAWADYCLALKGNQRGLFQEVQKVFDNAQKTEWIGIEHSFHRTVEKGHGRIETRRYWTFSAELLSKNTDQWAGLLSYWYR